MGYPLTHVVRYLAVQVSVYTGIGVLGACALRAESMSRQAHALGPQPPESIEAAAVFCADYSSAWQVIVIDIIHAYKCTCTASADVIDGKVQIVLSISWPALGHR